MISPSAGARIAWAGRPRTTIERTAKRLRGWSPWAAPEVARHRGSVVRRRFDFAGIPAAAHDQGQNGPGQHQARQADKLTE
jgi:hypothetical protein